MQVHQAPTPSLAVVVVGLKVRQLMQHGLLILTAAEIDSLLIKVGLAVIAGDGARCVSV